MRKGSFREYLFGHISMIWGVLKANRRLSELEEELSKLKRIVEERDLDWQDMRARCRRLLDRTEKAADRISEEANGNDVVTHATDGAKAASGRSMTWVITWGITTAVVRTIAVIRSGVSLDEL